MCQKHFDFIEELDFDIINNEGQQNNDASKIPKSPHLLCKINNINILALIDSGSQVTAISEILYERLKEDKKLLELPIANVTVSTAIGKKMTNVKKQISVKIEICDCTLSATMLVIPFLSSNVVLGNDFLLRNGIVIDYWYKRIKIKNETIPASAVLFERDCREKLFSSETNDKIRIYIIKWDEIKDQKGSNENENFSTQSRLIARNLAVLTESEQHIFYKLLQAYEEIFSDKPGCARNYEHKFKLMENIDRPKINKHYSVPLKLKEKVEKCIKEMLQTGIIERSISPYCNPLRIVLKNDVSVRVCLDAQQLNKHIEDDQEAPPIIEEIMQKFYDCKYFSKIDLTQGYFQIKLHEESRPFTAFRFGTKLYQFVRVSFGVKTAGSAFIRSLGIAFEKRIFNFKNEINDDDIGEECLDESTQTLIQNIETKMSNYIDDIVIGTKTFKGHMRMLQIIFEILRENNLTIKLKKCQFFQKQILFLGFELSNVGIKPDPERLRIIWEFEKPKNQRNLQQILGICNFYRRFVLLYSQLMHPFRDLLTKNSEWQWRDEHSQAYLALKQGFVEAVCLSHIIPYAPFKLQCDASITGIGGVLFQIDRDNHRRIISLASRCLTSAESKYMTTELELLAIVYCVTKFKYYLTGNKFEIITDHKSLTFLNSTQFHNARLIRWNLILQQYNFNISYCRGVDNIMADFLSRNPNGKFAAEDQQQI